VHKQHLKVSNQLGLHARAAMKLSDLATRYQSKIHVLHQGRRLDAKDIMIVMSLGASHGSLLEFHFEGSDELEAFNAIEQLFLDKFGED